MMALVYIVLILAILVGIIYFLYARRAQDDTLPYKAKSLFSRSEHEFLRILNEQIDTERYMIFPKVRLADFIAVTARGKEYQEWWNKIRSKHVDFLIWDVQNNKIALAIELDGKSHNSKNAQERDEFVNEIYKRIEVKLERVSVGSDFAEFAKRLNLC